MLARITSVAIMLVLASCAGPSEPTSWRDYVAETRAQGLLRQDRDPADVPFDAGVVTTSFEALAFDFEPNPFGAETQETGVRIIRKWRDPILYRVVSDSVAQPLVEDAFRAFADKLRTLTGHPIAEAPAGGTAQPNTLVIFASDETYAVLVEAASGAAAELAGLSEDDRDPLEYLGGMVEEWYRSTSPCGGRIGSHDRDKEDGRKGEIFFAVIMIRAEVPPALLQSCVEEEFAQAMGLFNDDYDVRPTIFNDDQEFALLTRHDEYLLQILYDPRIPMGASPDVAMPVVRQIASELVR